MKKMLAVLASCLLLGSLGGCGSAKDVFDIEFNISYSHIFTLQGDGATASYDLNLSDDEEYHRYESKIRSVKIGYLRYAITSNRGGGGRGDFYAGPYGSAFANARKVAQTITFAAGETRPTTDVDWIDLGYLESLLASGRVSLWAVGSGPGVDIIVPVEIKIEITANPLE